MTRRETYTFDLEKGTELVVHHRVAMKRIKT